MFITCSSGKTSEFKLENGGTDVRTPTDDQAITTTSTAIAASTHVHANEETMRAERDVDDERGESIGTRILGLGSG